ncbi:hypothetical protein FKW77_008768 [Venturia effusa]|uniref:Uncharacterized protein n=1 Tax=Venturia effusa TaxID=50376 RepID=A0A517LBH2_9PEZI|nr:hypothetical protein FKW77_008768 [Venturia effusa]
MHFSITLLFFSITTVLAARDDGSGPGDGGGQGSSMAMSAASSWITGYSLSASPMYPITGLTITTNVNGKDDMTTTSVGTFTISHESGGRSMGMNSTMPAVSMTGTRVPAVTSGSTAASLAATTTGTAAPQVTTNAAVKNAWSAAAGLAAIAGLVMA